MKGRRFEEKNQRGGKETNAEAHEGSSPCMAASSTYRLPLTGCTIAIASTFFAPPPTCLSSTRILHLQGGVTLKTLPVLNYSVPLSFSLSTFSSCSPSFSLRLRLRLFFGKLFFTSILFSSPLISSPWRFCFDTPSLVPSLRFAFLSSASSSFSFSFLVCFEAFRAFCSLELAEPLFSRSLRVDINEGCRHSGAPGDCSRFWSVG